MHPTSEIHQFRPTLTYLDLLSQKSKRSRGGGGDDSDSDDGPPPDPDEVPPETTAPRKEKKVGESKEVHATARKSDDVGGPGGVGVLSTVRREMLQMIRMEEEEKWEDLTFCDVAVGLYIFIWSCFYFLTHHPRRKNRWKHWNLSYRITMKHWNLALQLLPS